MTGATSARLRHFSMCASPSGATNRGWSQTSSNATGGSATSRACLASRSLDSISESGARSSKRRSRWTWNASGTYSAQSAYLPGLRHLRRLEAHLEGLGAATSPLLQLACSHRPMLDRRPPRSSWTATPRALWPTLRPGIRDHAPPPPRLPLLPENLVRGSTMAEDALSAT